RSISTSEMDAWARRWWRYFRSFSSSTRSCGKLRSAYQRDFQGLTIPSRNPRGCTFCPKALLLTVDDDGDVTRSLDPRGRTTHGGRAEAALARSLVDVRLANDQLVRIEETPGAVRLLLRV